MMLSSIQLASVSRNKRILTGLNPFGQCKSERIKALIIKSAKKFCIAR